MRIEGFHQQFRVEHPQRAAWAASTGQFLARA